MINSSPVAAGAQLISHLDDCAICLDPLDIEKTDLTSVEPCSHLFHRGCVEQWLNANETCPSCRSSVDKTEIFSSKFGLDVKIDQITEKRIFQSNNIDALEKFYDADSAVARLSKKNVYDRAIRYNSMPILQWALDNNYPTNVRDFASAAKLKKYEMLKTLVENGCPINDDDGGDTITALEKNNEIELSEWAYNQGFPRECFDGSLRYRDK